MRRANDFSIIDLEGVKLVYLGSIEELKLLCDRQNGRHLQLSRIVPDSFVRTNIHFRKEEDGKVIVTLEEENMYRKEAEAKFQSLGLTIVADDIYTSYSAQHYCSLCGLLIYVTKSQLAKINDMHKFLQPAPRSHAQRAPS